MRRKISFLNLYKQYLSIKEDVDTAIHNTIIESAFIGGGNVKQFEKEFALYQDSTYCVGVGNGTDALEIAIESLELPPNSEIIVPANSFIASAEAVTRAGHRVVFCDNNETDYTISIDSLINKISSKTAAIIAVHLYGMPCQMTEILDVAKEHGLKVVEDCAQAHGAEYLGKKVGSIGDIGTFSFYPGKNLGAYGDGGAIITNNEELAKKCRMIANHGRVEKYNHEFEGRNSRLDGLQASILSVKLKKLDEWIVKRISIAKRYKESLEGIDAIKIPKDSPGNKSVWHLFVIRVNNRGPFINFLNENGIETGIHYPISLPKLAAFRYCNQANECFVANEFDNQLVSLPIGEHLDSEDVEYILEKIHEYFK